jgi:hypothetical protein
MTQTPADAWAKLAELQAASDKLFNPAVPQAEWNVPPEKRREFRRLVEVAVALCRSQGIYEHVMAQIKSETSTQKETTR